MIDYFKFMMKLTGVFYPEAKAKTAAMHLFQGAMFYPMRALHYWAMRAEKGERRQKIVEIGKHEIEKHIKDIAAKVLSLYEEMP